MGIAVIDLYQYPVKGIAGTRLAEVVLRPGLGLPGDRRFGIGLGGGGLEPARLLGLIKHPRLAALSAEFDAASDVLAICRQGRPVARGNVTTPAGRATIEQFFSAYLDKELHGPARLMDAAAAVAVGATGTDHVVPPSAPELGFTDPAHETVSIINLASVHDLERVVGEAVDLRRFRANIYLDGIPAWSEFDWVGQTVGIGGARLHVTERTERCAATNVNPTTCARDLNLPLALRRGFGHIDMGVYATVVDGGQVVAEGR